MYYKANQSIYTAKVHIAKVYAFFVILMQKQDLDIFILLIQLILSNLDRFNDSLIYFS